MTKPDRAEDSKTPDPTPSGSSDLASSQRSSPVPSAPTHGRSALERDRRIKRMVDRVRSQMFHRK